VATIKDVAALAGVGIGTVSRVLNDQRGVTPETRARVLDAIARLDYHPHRVGRALSGRRFGAVAVLVPFFTHPSAVERLSGVMSVTDPVGLDVVLFNVDHPRARASHLARLVRRDVADGVLILSLTLSDDERQWLRDNGVCTVVVDADAPGLPNVVIDDTEGGRMAGRHLLELGHRRIAYVSDAIDPAFGFTSSGRRQRGLEEVLAEAGHPLDPALVGPGIHDPVVARRVAAELLALAERPTAVFAHSDTQALGVLEAATSVGLRVPEDLSVIGFDDIQIAHFAGLSTVRQPLFESGRLGAVRLLELLESGTTSGPERIELPLEVVPRRTTGPVPSTRRRARTTPQRTRRTGDVGSRVAASITSRSGG
jgi:LacI family transcriptional regulator